ncbi:hypothetical protein NDS46_11160 [Paenibacillus thiaminolyticus]|uniref:hypothetical protein n=1 Tax=Paenibacillus thiaminolyticus TaxID=49283 RepID=UPI002330DF61|nr:hypothetical protein [Paenibacillus thiaminolyticus]WCF10366.1 hypothetical protein NDS46_11160 [Paenibacillus thiaminolyticus]
MTSRNSPSVFTCEFHHLIGQSNRIRQAESTTYRDPASMHSVPQSGKRLLQGVPQSFMIQGVR